MFMSDKMTIAQALRRIKKLKGQIAEHTQRAQQGVSYVSTKVPAFRFKDEMEAMTVAKTEMVNLEAAVAVANATSIINIDGKSVTVTKAIRDLQELKGLIAFLKGLNLRAEVVRERESEWDDTELKNISRVTEVTYVSDLTEQNRDQMVRDLQDQFETLNNWVESINHSVMV
jgi:hypothetical protein